MCIEKGTEMVYSRIDIFRQVLLLMDPADVIEYYCYPECLEGESRQNVLSQHCLV